MKPIDHHAALVIIDLQKGMRFPEAGRRNNPDAERQAAALLSLWRGTSRPIVHVRHISRSAGNLGFDTIVVDDASFAFDLRDLSGRCGPPRTCTRCRWPILRRIMRRWR
jgi:nicotinamidase-related amidase